MSAGFDLPTSAEMTRIRPLHRLVEPWLERGHTYARYAAFLDRLDPARFDVVPLRELAATPRDARPRVGLRHDVDDRLESALEFARLEHDRGLRATYFVLHTARYYARDDLVSALLRLQELGHEVGFHYDLVTLQVTTGADPRAYLAGELARLRSAGVDVSGAAAHGSYWGHKLGYKNDYFFRELSVAQPGFPNVDRVGDVELAKGSLAEFDLAYDAALLPTTHYWTDSWTDASGKRWHPELAALDALGPSDCAIVLVHACHWDSSLPAKYARTVARLARRAVEVAAR